MEIEQEFRNAVDGPGWDGVTDALNRSEKLLKATWERNGEEVAKGLEAIHDATAYLLNYKDET